MWLFNRSEGKFADAQGTMVSFALAHFEREIQINTGFE
jgi:hypothetical protein